MLSLATRNISGFGVSFALAALLLNCATASAAGAPGDARDQAAALLSRGTMTVERGASMLAPEHPSASSVDPTDQARRLLSGAQAVRPVEKDEHADASSQVATTGAVAAYANAEESARRMILGSGA